MASKSKKARLKPGRNLPRTLAYLTSFITVIKLAIIFNIVSGWEQMVKII
jgi:hypothetical protein